MIVVNNIVKILLTNLVWSFVYGWLVKNNNFVSNFPYKTFQKKLRNLTSWSDIMLLNIPWSWAISLNNKFVMLVASFILWQDMKYVILENISTTIKIEFLTFFYLEKPSIESINILTQGSLGINKKNI